MPRYDYRCEAGHTYEKQEPFRSPVEHPCERCGKTARRVLVAPPLIFKSGGFYKTSSRGGTDTGNSDDSSSSRSKKKAPAQKNAEDVSVTPSSQAHSTPAAADD